MGRLAGWLAGSEGVCLCEDRGALAMAGMGMSPRLQQQQQQQQQQQHSMPPDGLQSRDTVRRGWGPVEAGRVTGGGERWWW